MEAILNPWPWYVAGPIIALTMFTLLYFGKTFGVSGNLRTLCTVGGAGKFADFFRFNWKGQIWNLVFVLGAIIGGFISFQFLSPTSEVLIAQDSINQLEQLGFSDPGRFYLPPEIFGTEAIFSLKGILILISGGILVGFGARYAGGCTSGHAITGMSNLQLPSLITVIGFFIGGLIMVYLVYPVLFG
jgi:uncharacterized membrane protein YedE/YeeE